MIIKRTNQKSAKEGVISIVNKMLKTPKKMFTITLRCIRSDVS